MMNDIPTLTDILEPGDPDKAAVVRDKDVDSNIDVASEIDEDEAPALIENRDKLQELLVDIVDRVLDEALPAIEEQLRDRLISTLHEQLGEEITRLTSKASGGVKGRGKKKSSGPPKEHNPSLYGF